MRLVEQVLHFALAIGTNAKARLRTAGVAHIDRKSRRRAVVVPALDDLRPLAGHFDPVALVQDALANRRVGEALNRGFEHIRRAAGCGASRAARQQPRHDDDQRGDEQHRSDQGAHRPQR